MRLRHLLRSAADRVPLPASMRQRLDRFDARYRLARALDASGIAGPLSHDIEQWAPFVRFAPPGHFYSPIPRLDELAGDADRVFDRDVELPHIDLREAEQLALVERIAAAIADDPLVADRVPERRYYSNNPAYGIGDASMLFGMLMLHRPSRIVEIGSGYSSALILDVVERHLPGTSVTFVEPYSELLRSLMHESDDARCEVLEQRAQDVSLERLEQLEAGDVLFIDSTHVVRTGSDVCRLVLEVLPALQPGVVVHVHDIFWPFELPRTWVEEGRQWAECYLLRAYLTDNPNWRILLFNDYLGIYHRPFMERVLPRFLENTGGSLWLQRV